MSFSFARCENSGDGLQNYMNMTNLLNCTLEHDEDGKPYMYVFYHNLKQ